MAELITPSWFNQRQGKAEPAGDDCYRLIAPNMKDAFIAIRREGNAWSANLRQAADGADIETTPAEFLSRAEAWSAAFELYRTALVV